MNCGRRSIDQAWNRLQPYRLRQPTADLLRKARKAARRNHDWNGAAMSQELADLAHQVLGPSFSRPQAHTLLTSLPARIDTVC